MNAENGLFWVADAPESAVQGSLVVDEEQGIRLELAGALTPAWVSTPQPVADDATVSVVELTPAHDDDHLLVHGVLLNSPRLATLVDCITIQRRDVGTPSGGFETQVLSPRYMLRGSHSAGNEQLFDAVRIRVTNIDSWANLAGFTISPFDAGSATLSYNKPPTIEARCTSGARVKVHEALSRSWPRATGGHISRKTWIQCDEFKECTYEEIQRRFVTPLVSYLSMLIGTRSPLVDVSLRSADTWMSVSSRNLPNNESTAEKRPDEILLPLGVVSFDTVAKFIDLSEAVGPLPPVIADAHGYLSRATLETQVLELATVAEGLHRRAFPDETRMGRNDADRLRSNITAALVDEDQKLRDVVQGMLTHLEDMGYARRLAALADRVSNGLPGATGNAKKWVKAVANARNSYAHRTSGYLDKGVIDEFFAVSSSLKWVLTGVCILESGVSEVVLAARVQDHPTYRQFLKNMREALPSVYG